jgi:hypothetical protein
LIAHERLSSVETRFGFFSKDNPLAGTDLSKRLAIYAGLGKNLDLFHPDESAAAIALQLEKGVLHE